MGKDPFSPTDLLGDLDPAGSIRAANTKLSGAAEAEIATLNFSQGRTWKNSL
jgi:hypothetical protein